jgi:hypothetical protein
MPFKDPEKRKEYVSKYYEDRNKNARDSITSGEIIDQHNWEMWCNTIKIRAKQNKHPYSCEFTNDVMFKMMVQGCFYCRDVATTIDRIDSTLDHTPKNCVGCCLGCNNSKGAADISTFIRKAYYRARGEYADDDNDIWFVNKQKPSMWNYKRNAEKKGVSFELTNENWKQLIKGKCVYCRRTPTTWFGIDRVIPSSGYVIDNVFSCCFDCNVDKHEDDVETMMKRNERIADRVDAGELLIYDCSNSNIILHKGINKTSKKVCAYGKVYASKIEASRALGKNDTYVTRCIRDGRHSNDIFEITDEY